ncbi:DUF4347 domain-containing protein [Durusdinium trenchii]|uniref:DUF4347 domain-containing protein n=1 Tax=Durusdinium trenchii TaxID=1381693 RepID=A0ABP0M577_9DINO
MDVDDHEASQQTVQPVAPVPTPPQQPLTPEVLQPLPVPVHQLTPEIIQELIQSGKIVIPMAPVAPVPATAVVAQPAQTVQPSERPEQTREQPSKPEVPAQHVVPQPQPVPPQQPLEVPAQPAATPAPPVRYVEGELPTMHELNGVPTPALTQAPAQPTVAPEQPLEVPQPVPPQQPLEIPAQPVAPEQPLEEPFQPTLAPPPAQKPQIGDAELAAMGWKVDKSCRPQASPQTSPKPSPQEAADAYLQRLKSKVFDAENDGAKTKSHAPPSAPAGSQMHKAQQNQEAFQTAKEQQQEYSRRAAANLISRLQKNPGRMERFPDLKKLVFSETRKSELISTLCDQNGDLEQVNLKLMVQEEKGQAQIARKKAVRYTKKQMNDMYGDDAATVMKHKEATGMVEDDENNPGGFVYLVSQKEDEQENYNRSSSLNLLDFLGERF